VPGHADEEGAVVSVVGRPPILRRAEELLEIGLDVAPVDLLQRFVVLLLDLGRGQSSVLRGLVVEEGATAGGPFGLVEERHFHGCCC